MGRPVLFVLAGVNGAGKSSIGGHLLTRKGLSWFNPDTYARELRVVTGDDSAQANAAAWQEGVRRLDVALEAGHTYAFETTLGGRTICQRILEAARTHDVAVWYCGLASPEQHIERVRARVEAGGHDIPEAMIRARCVSSMQNLIVLMPHLARLQVYDNSTDATPGAAIADPVLVAEMVAGKLIRPAAVEEFHRTPEWAKPLVAAALGS